MKPKELLTADYLDIVYDQRNKNYGGYELRRHYDQRLRKAAALALTGVVAILSFSFISVNHKNEDPKGSIRVVDLTRIEPVVPPLPKTKVQPPPPPPPAAAKPQRTVTRTDPVIRPNDLVKPDETLTANNKTGNANPGLSNADGDSTGIGSELATTGGTTSPAGDNTPEPPATWVEQMPQFNGDMNAYISKHIHYPDMARENNIEGKVAIEFIVNEDGSVSNARVTRSVGGGCDEEALRIVNGMPKWKPGKNNGRAVKVYCVLPIFFQLEK